MEPKITLEQLTNAPNLISMSRPLFGAVIVLLLLDAQQTSILLAAVLVLLCEASDILDGVLARATKQVTTIGSYLDPVCDTLYRTLVFVGLFASGWVGPLQLLVLFAVELVLPYLRAFGIQLGASPASPILTRVKSAVHAIAIIASLFLLSWLSWVDPSSIDWVKNCVVGVAGAAVAVSLLHFTVEVVRLWKLSL